MSAVGNELRISKDGGLRLIVIRLRGAGRCPTIPHTLMATRSERKTNDEVDQMARYAVRLCGGGTGPVKPPRAHTRARSPVPGQY
jgi:hypothetical protein